ncbi:MAG: FAD-dependent oxidoreductase [Acidimicrobiales bacterium]|nr:FAD-dependent oxidoreductase [Acidimicrobiales bacterium]
MAQVAVVGAGVAGLGSALALARRGHQVTLLERDATPMPSSADEAFWWDRRGAPQVRHSHALLARLRNLLRDHHPDVLDALLEAGATEIRFAELLPPTIAERGPRPGDDDLVALACRRTTFEWVLRRAVLAQPGVVLLDGVAVEGLGAEAGDPPRITGVRVRVRGDGEVAVQPADLVVVAGGRRSTLPAWLDEVGAAPVPEQVEDTGIVYLSRFYRLRPGAGLPPRDGPIGGDLGYLKYGVFQGDNDTFSVTLATPTADTELRSRLQDAATFDATAALLGPTAPWVDPARAEAITEVHLMAGLLNRLRRFVVDGRPVALGVAAVGDAGVCTNPLYGRGCSLAMVHAHLLAESLQAHPSDALALALAFDAATEEQVVPWYRAAVAQDTQARAAAEAAARGEEPHAEGDAAAFQRSVVQDGLLPATRIDPDVFRAFVRSFNLLALPDALMHDPVVAARVLEVWGQRHERAPEPPLGPPRAELLAALAS